MNNHVNAKILEQPKQDESITIPRTAVQNVEKHETETTSEDEERWTSYVQLRPTYEEVIETATRVLGNIMRMYECEQALGKYTQIITLYKNYKITKREASARLEDLEYTVLCVY